MKGAEDGRKQRIGWNVWRNRQMLGGGARDPGDRSAIHGAEGGAESKPVLSLAGE